MNATPKMSRLVFLDNIKVLFVILVIIYHSAITYGVTGWWYYIAELNENYPTNDITSLLLIGLTVLGALFQSSFMGLFFLLGGYFTPESYDRKGFIIYWKDRLIRLGTPLVLYIVIIDPLMVYILARLGIAPWSSFSILQGSFLSFYLDRFQSIDGIIEFLSSTGPMWFLLVLLVFTGGYTLWRQVANQESLKIFVTHEYQIPKIPILLLISLILGFFTFVIRLYYPVGEVNLGIPLSFIIQYILMFIFGIFAYRYDWFKKMDKSHMKKWIVIILASAIFFLLYVAFIFRIDTDFNAMAGGFTLDALIYAIIDNIICMGMIFTIIPIFRDRFNNTGKLMKSLSINAYYMYLVHAPLLVLVSLLVASIMVMPGVKLFLVSFITIILSYLFSNYLLRKFI